jgi:hypothetical protein
LRRYPFAFLCLSATNFKIRNILCGTHLPASLAFLCLSIPGCKVLHYPSTASWTTPVSIQMAFLRIGTPGRASQSSEDVQMSVQKEASVSILFQSNQIIII